MHNKLKIINDPIYGFIKIPYDLIYDIIQHPIIQRLRRIKQLGLSDLVYPGATHSRFQHVLGAMYLMEQAINVLKSKGVDITPKEEEGALLAILLHDIGHAPFSHSLEFKLVENVPHEALSLYYMRKINQQFNGKLDTCIAIFNNSYPKKFLHQLVSGQLDTDRMDYLRRDSFYTGVVEGAIGSDRIIKMLTIKNGELAVESKGIYSIEKFLIARRLMYWQVYLHKTVVAAELQLIHIINRVKFLIKRKTKINVPDLLTPFLSGKIKGINDLDKKFRYAGNELSAADLYILMDDNDIFSAIKIWSQHPDTILSRLCNDLLNRNLMRIEIFETLPDDIHQRLKRIENCLTEKFNCSEDDFEYLYSHGTISHRAYKISNERINIAYKDGTILDITEASDISNLTALSRTVTKSYLFYPKECIK